MSLRDRTKRMFAEALKEMVRAKPLEKVRIKELCARCGTDRQTFYYHFKDKYDLAAWIFIQDYEASLSDAEGTYSVKHAARILERIKVSEAFYKRAFSDLTQNAVSKYIYTYFVELGVKAVKAYLGADSLETDVIYAIKSHSFACVGHTMEWLDGITAYTPEEFAALQYQFMPSILKKAYGIPLSAPALSSSHTDDIAVADDKNTGGSADQHVAGSV